MIAFPCHQCGTRFDRPENSAGTLVWCACGARNTVPWESSLPPLPEEPAEPQASPPAPPPSPPLPSAWDSPSLRPVIRQRSKSYCFNHQETPPQHTCGQCGEGFCADCVVTLEGRTLCGPCKNYQLRALQRPPQVSIPAILAPIIALLGGPGVILVLFAVGGAAETRGNRGASAIAGLATCALFGVVVQLIALILAALALRGVESNPRIAGRALAITGMVAALVCAMLVAEVALLMFRTVS